MAVRNSARECADSSYGYWLGSYSDFVANTALAGVVLLGSAQLTADDPYGGSVVPWLATGAAVSLLLLAPWEVSAIYAVGVLAATAWPSKFAWCGLTLGVLLTNSSAALQLALTLTVAALVLFANMVDPAVILTVVVSCLTVVIIVVVLFYRPTRKRATATPSTYEERPAAPVRPNVEYGLVM